MEGKGQYRAYKSVKTNKGAPGVDEMTIEAALTWWREHNHKLVERIRRGKYTPSPFRRVEIPKPDGEVRKLGIPTVTSYCTPPNDVLECCLHFA